MRLPSDTLAINTNAVSLWLRTLVERSRPILSSVYPFRSNMMFGSLNSTLRARVSFCLMLRPLVR